MEKLDHHFADDQDLDMELELEASVTLAGNVLRALEDGFAMNFDFDEEGDDRLISEITGFQTGYILA